MAVAMRTNNYFELRNREMGFYTELRTAIILARINVDRTALRLFRERANAIRRVLASPAMGGGGKKREREKKQNKTESYYTDILYRTILITTPSRSKRIGLSGQLSYPSY